MVTLQVPVWGLLLLGYGAGTMATLLAMYLTSGVKLVNRTPRGE